MMRRSGLRPSTNRNTGACAEQMPADKTSSEKEWLLPTGQMLDKQQGLLEEAGFLADDDDAYEHPMPLATRGYSVAIFSLMVALLCADQNLLAPHLTAAAQSFNMNAAERDTYLGGYIMAAFFAVGAPAALVVGYLTDRCNRKLLLFVVVMIGATPCLLTYWVTQFWELLVLRTLTGISVGGVSPLIFSIMGDLFPISQRSAMAAFIGVCAGLGGTAGQAISDWTGTTNWRLPFVLVATPSILTAFFMLVTTQEPPRGGFEEALRGVGEYKETVSWPKVKQLLQVPSNWIIFLQGLPGCLPWGMMITFLNDYLAQDKGFNIHVATSIVLVYGFGGMTGSVLGGVLGQWLYNQRKEYMALLMGASVLGGTWPLYYLVNAPLTELSLTCTMAVTAVGGAVAGMAPPNIRAATMNVNTPETRGVAFALQTMTDDLGKGLGPVMVAWFIKLLGRRGAFNAAICGWVPCGLMLTSLALCMRKDEAGMQARLLAAAGDAEAQAPITSPTRSCDTSGSSTNGTPAPPTPGSYTGSSPSINGNDAHVYIRPIAPQLAGSTQPQTRTKGSGLLTPEAEADAAEAGGGGDGSGGGGAAFRMPVMRQARSASWLTRAQGKEAARPAGNTHGVTETAKAVSPKDSTGLASGTSQVAPTKDL